MKRIKVADRIQNIDYAIRDVAVYANAIERQGREIIYLNIGDPVKYDFDTPEHIKEALITAVLEGSNDYSPSEGIPELRETICEKEKRISGTSVAPENVIVTEGVSEAIQMVMATLIDSGDEILVPDPTYPSYPSYVKLFGGKPVSYKTVEENGWQPDIEDIRSKITDSTIAIVIINPNNPSGALYSKQILKEIAEIASDHDLLLLSDEIYDRIVYEGTFTNVATVAKDLPAICLNGFSKTYLMTGWRLGYLYLHDPDNKLVNFLDGVTKAVRMRLSANTPVQKAAVKAIEGPQDHIQEMVTKLRLRRDYALKRIDEIDGISCTKPHGAFYVFPKIEEEIRGKWKDDKEFVLDLLRDERVLLVHGSGFGTAYGSDHFRGVFLPPQEVLETAFDRIERFIQSK